MGKTKIDWCDSTWNPVTGCLYGCGYCYAKEIAERFSTEDKCHMLIGGRPVEKEHKLDEPVIESKTGKKAPYPFGFEPTFHRYCLNDYIGKQGRNISVCSMSDLFGEWVPDSWIDEVLAACDKAPQHNYLFLTKNPERYDEYGVTAYTVPGIFNLWYGMSVTIEEDFNRTWLLPEYCNTFINIEPIMDDLHIRNMDSRFDYLDWIIVGAATGIRKEKVVPKRGWIEQIIEGSRKYNIPLFMKSSLADIWGEPLIQEFPEGLRRKQHEKI